MKLLITGSSGYVGRFIVSNAQKHGDTVIHMSRKEPQFGEWLEFDLSRPISSPPKADALIHCAFDHVPGKYRGGEGSDPEGFLKRNLEGSITLFKAARDAGIPKIIFLSSRAVYDGYAATELLVETLPLNPTSLYGQLKWELEKSLSALNLIDVSFRATGIYGQAEPGGYHKWETLFSDFEQGKDIAPRAGTELHGADLAAAIRLALVLPNKDIAGEVFNVSDIMVDRHDLLSAYARHKGLKGTIPEALKFPEKAAMDCSKLTKLGWRPRGQSGLASFIQSL